MNIFLLILKKEFIFWNLVTILNPKFLSQKFLLLEKLALKGKKREDKIQCNALERYITDVFEVSNSVLKPYLCQLLKNKQHCNESTG